MAKPKQAVRVPGELPGDDEEAIPQDVIDEATVAAVEASWQDQPVTSGDANDVEDLIAAAATGDALKVNKPRVPLPPAPDMPDETRPATAPRNASAVMPYTEAMGRLHAAEKVIELEESGQPVPEELREYSLKRSTLTDRGWVCAPVRKPRERR